VPSDIEQLPQDIIPGLYQTEDIQPMIIPMPLPAELLSPESVTIPMSGGYKKVDNFSIVKEISDFISEDAYADKLENKSRK